MVFFQEGPEKRDSGRILGCQASSSSYSVSPGITIVTLLGCYKEEPDHGQALHIAGEHRAGGLGPSHSQAVRRNREYLV